MSGDSSCAPACGPRTRPPSAAAPLGCFAVRLLVRAWASTMLIPSYMTDGKDGPTNDIRCEGTAWEKHLADESDRGASSVIHTRARCECSSHRRRPWWWHALRRKELDDRGEEIGQGREQLWVMVGGVHVGREEGAVCIRSPESTARQRRARGQSAPRRGQEAKLALSCAGGC